MRSRLHCSGRNSFGDGNNSTERRGVLLSGDLDENDRLGGNMKHTKFYYLCRAAYRRRHDDTETISGMGSAGADSGLRAWEAAMVLQQARSVLSEHLMAGMYSGKLIFFRRKKSLLEHMEGPVYLARN